MQVDRMSLYRVLCGMRSSRRLPTQLLVRCRSEYIHLQVSEPYLKTRGLYTGTGSST
jgi:hypothetical protein